MKRDDFTVYGAKILFRNFEGKGTQYNPEGVRNFCLLLDDDRARKLQDEGWNVRWLKPRDPDEAEQGYIQVAVRFDKFPPKVVLISSNGKSALDEESIGILDWADIENIDLTVTPNYWTISKGTKSEKSGIKAYLQAIYVTIHEDELEKKYRDIPGGAVDAIGGCGNCDTCTECAGGCKHDQ